MCKKERIKLRGSLYEKCILLQQIITIKKIFWLRQCMSQPI